MSGSGNVAQYTAEKLIDLGARPVTLSDSDGFIHDPAGIDHEKLEWVKELKNVRRGRIRAYADNFPRVTYTSADAVGHNLLWEVPADCAFPSATQNEISAEEAKSLLGNGIVAIVEGANMPSTPEAVELFLAAGILYAPGKAANAGGVAVSGLEMAQDSERRYWARQEVDAQLRSIMRAVHDQVRLAAEEYGCAGNYVAGANIAGFRKVADAMLDEAVI